MSIARSVTKTGVKLDVVGHFIELDISGCTELRGQVDLEYGTFGAARLAFEFSCTEQGGKFHEPTSANRLAAEGVNATAVDCSGFMRARLRVVVASATSATAGAISLSARGN